jgi:hypothetical protein
MIRYALIAAGSVALTAISLIGWVLAFYVAQAIGVK